MMAEHHRMRPIRRTIPIDEARQIVDDAIVPLDRTVRIALAEAGGRVLAEALTSSQDVPPFDRAAMDGYAVVAADTDGASQDSPAALTVVESVHSGSVPTRQVAPGQATQIATGAPLPEGADAVVMVEATERPEADRVHVLTGVTPRQNIGPRGADIAQGETALHPGDLLTPSRLGAAAALGFAEVEVYDRPVVAIVSTGNEIVEPGRPLAPGQIYDVNRYTLTGVIEAHGGVASPRPVAVDTLASLDDALASMTDADIIVFSGGSSVGEKDLTLDLLQQHGEVLFHGLAVKPGKPTAFGRVGQTPVLGMPGYPTSCLSNAYLLLIPLLRSLARLPRHELRSVTVPAAGRMVSTANRHQFYSVRVEDGQAVGAFKSSGSITSMSRADGYIEIPIGVDAVEAGTLVDVKLF